MWSLSAWHRRRILDQHPVDDDVWNRVLHRLAILDGLTADQHQQLLECSVLFLRDKHLTALPGVELNQEQRLFLAAQAQLPLLNLGDLNWYRGFHEVLLYPGDFVSPQRHRDASGVEHEWEGKHSGEAWSQGPVILAWPGVLSSGSWNGSNLVIHELAHKLDMLNGSADGFPPLHSDMRNSDWASAMQSAYDHLNQQLDYHPHSPPAIDPYAAQNPAEFFAVTSEYFFSAPDALFKAFPAVYEQLKAFYRQDTLSRLHQLRREHHAHNTHD
ncbi:zinc-dependent peptidase [Pseudomonas sp. 10B1]|uniref:M90 family metallopeptidase n=1 Tax=unclassified Pseudomonas TaxID=196821 RepID=UPI002AB46330|nr:MULTISPECIES: M90 family metallopeptidase [unclassified Pseudomonas]MDY7562039.1 zinc-dependent peptidase [Pseudomonas sp. AB6]MEA9978584.1 zinc-dependent peptidase [Pseudomonas sp. RTS4]MEA9993561.1 zinc-dependent peptidase [Pseudomonas sp. AA4]MEB0087060.1 zinc-dependent peptidase [Pseudomonas sp. RTI1]MEB0126166.1 zinc-dependent peptidase [Pseudomonas sp. CCC1.2]